MYGYVGTALGFASASWQWQPSPHDPAPPIEILDVITSAVAITAALTDQNDTLTGAISSQAGASVDGALTDQRDTLSATLTVPAGLAGALTDKGDTLTGTATVAVALTGTWADQRDSLTGTASVTVGLAGTVTDANDSLSGTVAVPINATGTWTDQNDTLTGAISGQSILGLDGAWIDQQDSLTGDLSITNAPTGPVQADGDIDRMRRKRPIIHYMPARKLEEALEIIEDIRPAARVSQNKKAIKQALAVITEITPSPDYAGAIANIREGLKRVSRETARHEGLIKSLMRIAVEMTDTIADMQRKRALQKKKNLERILWLL